MTNKDFFQSIFNLSRKSKRLIVVILDLFISGLSVWLSFGLRLDIWMPVPKLEIFVWILTLVIWFPLFIIFGMYRSVFRYIDSTVFELIIKTFLCYTLIVFFVLTIVGIDGVPRSIGIIQPLLMFFGVTCSRFFIFSFLQLLLSFDQKNDAEKPRVIIYGAGKAGRQLAASLKIQSQVLIKCFVDDDPKLRSTTLNNIPIYGSDNLHRLISRMGITDVLLAIPSANQDTRNQIISKLYGSKARIKTIRSYNNFVFGSGRALELADLDVNDLLGREVSDTNFNDLRGHIKGKSVLITGAGGSIGGELCRQIFSLSPSSIIILDNSEHALYSIYEELKSAINNSSIAEINRNIDISELFGRSLNKINIIPCLASVQNKHELKKIFFEHSPDFVFHVAAYKHVPLVEENPLEGLSNNVFGTLTCVEVSIEKGVPNFVLVSTDKAVRPTNIMGASKRISELIVQAMANHLITINKDICLSVVRFGNVLNSSGSVIPLFRKQINDGGPVTLTHPEIVRYFMTIPEAIHLIIQSCMMASSGDLFVLDMGKPVRILDLATKMINLSGLTVRSKDNPAGDIEIKITGLRHGEKLYEELLISGDPIPTSHPKIMKIHENYIPLNILAPQLEKLRDAILTSDLDSALNLLKKLVPEYKKMT